MTLQELAALLAERGYGYAIKPIQGISELEGETEVFAVRGQRESQYLGVTSAILQLSAEQFRHRWGYERLGISRETYLQRAAKEIADFIRDQAEGDTQWTQQITQKLLAKLLFELEEAGYLINTPPIYGEKP